MKVTSTSIISIIIPHKEQNLRQGAAARWPLPLLSLQATGTIYLSNQFLCLYKHFKTPNQSHLSSQHFSEGRISPDLVETRWDSFLSWAEDLMDQTQQWHRRAISRNSHYNQDLCCRDSQDAGTAFRDTLPYTECYKQPGWQLFLKVKKGYVSLLTVKLWGEIYKFLSSGKLTLVIVYLLKCVQ